MLIEYEVNGKKYFSNLICSYFFVNAVLVCYCDFQIFELSCISKHIEGIAVFAMLYQHWKMC
jgi:hypothetical protein